MNWSPKRASRHDDDGDKGGDNEGDVEEEEGDDDFAHPRGQVDIAALLPVEHLGDEAGLEGHHRHDQQGHREYLGGEMIIWIDLANSYYLIISKKTVLSPT